MSREKLMDQTIALLLRRLDGIRFRRMALGLFWMIAAPACKFDQTGTTNVPPPTVTISSSEQSQIIDWGLSPPDGRHFGLIVRDEAQLAEAREKVTKKYGLKLIPGFRCVFRDPFGNRIDLV